MAEIKFTIPGALQYSKVVITATPEELGLKDLDAYSLGVANTVFLNLFKQGVAAGKSIDVSPPKGETEKPKRGALAMEVDKRSAVIDELAASNLAQQSMEETKAILEAGLGSTTEVPWKKSVAPRTPPWEEPKSVENVEVSEDLF